MKDVKAAVCIPTYNRPEVVKDFLDNALSEYVEFGFDIFFYDSSEDCQTEEVIKNEKYQNCRKVHYLRVPSTVHANMKVYNIYREFGNSLEYDYVWICGDAIRWSRRVLENVYVSLNNHYDLIVLNHNDIEKIGNKEYTEHNPFFGDCAWVMTFFGATILNVSTMLSNVEWDFLMKKYMVPESINHSHVAFYFEKIINLRQLNALHLSFELIDMMVSVYKKTSGWYKEIFYVWCYCWPVTINKLPLDYARKDEVIRKHGINSGLLSYSNFKRFRRENIFNLEIYKLYKKRWSGLTDVPRIVIWSLSVLPAWMVDCWKYRYEIWTKRKIKIFCHRFEKIYIYGAGKKARRYSRYLSEMNLPFEAFLVSDMKDNKEELDFHAVFLFSDKLLSEGNTGILIALNESNTEQVLKGSLKGVKRKIVFSEYGIKNIK